MVTVKIQCSCGQRYAFDVEPVTGQMPSEVRCPMCGVDGTAAANQAITENLAQQAPTAIAPKLHLNSPPGHASHGFIATVYPRPLVKPSWFLKGMNLEAAQRHVKNAWVAGTVQVVVTVVFCLLSLTGTSVWGITIWNLVDAALLAGLSFGIYKYSRACSVAVFLLYFVNIAYYWKRHVLGWPIGLLFIYIYFQGVRGTFAFHQIHKAARIG